MKTEISIFLKDYDCNVVEQTERAKGTRYKAYGYFDDIYLETQGSSFNSALRRLKHKAEMALD
ncbi:hypothetical protein KKC08_01640 [Patescibacteria group bacterium]|nr:hypothetical protein [Patescibacteria group bacterium]MCG2701776.1 hypothetical protein [Candidatus Parcubacteria bacterium]MBU4264680.1 hypothetical protein [Patescibacteria group bacterium]MBU4390635.1 hypothetical protein [Patescibacteria group bacterium]MBU4396854.1 hypothetical protein [Patescibacteria group bacterium]